jgi:hypothetical protein
MTSRTGLDCGRKRCAVQLFRATSTFSTEAARIVLAKADGRRGELLTSDAFVLACSLAPALHLLLIAR